MPPLCEYYRVSMNTVLLCGTVQLLGMTSQEKTTQSQMAKATHIEFDDVVYQIAGDGLTIHLVDDHLLQG